MTHLKSYITGFILSIVLTLAAFIPVWMNVRGIVTFSSWNLILYVVTLAIVQLVVQLFFFLHVGEKQNARINTVILIITMALVLILVIASLWIMSHLDRYHMSPEHIQEYLRKSQSF